MFSEVLAWQVGDTYNVVISCLLFPNLTSAGGLIEFTVQTAWPLNSPGRLKISAGSVVQVGGWMM